MNNPKVSIIIPVYNRNEFLPETILSCINQTYSNIEIIIVDDGSTEDIKSTVKSVFEQSSRKIDWKYIWQKRSNANVARNNGIKKATGDTGKLYG